MSRKNLGNILPSKKTEKIEQELALRISNILRQEYDDRGGAIKLISRKIKVESETVKKWYNARNPPRSEHLLTLAAHYPEVMKLLLDLSGHSYLIPLVLSSENSDATAKLTLKRRRNLDKNVPINVPIKSWHDNLNERQEWFLKELGHALRPTAADIIKRWGITERTAKRDLAHLMERGVITYIGSKKTGFYELRS